jgi:hypothetical protein
MKAEWGGGYLGDFVIELVEEVLSLGRLVGHEVEEARGVLQRALQGLSFAQQSVHDGSFVV